MNNVSSEGNAEQRLYRHPLERKVLPYSISMKM